MLQAVIPLEAFRAELRRRLEMIRRQKPFGGRSIGSFTGPAQARAVETQPPKGNAMTENHDTTAADLEPDDLTESVRRQTVSAKTEQTTEHAEIPVWLRGKINEGQADDAFLWWAQLTGNAPIDWTDHGQPVTVESHRFSDLRSAACGLATVTRLLRLAGDAADSKISPSLVCGLSSAAVALADLIDGDLQCIEDGFSK